jgi:hypothetical protein
MEVSPRRRPRDNQNPSPTARTNSIFLLALIAAKERREVCTLDITGAYLNADTTNDVYVRIPAKIASVLCDHHPLYTNHLAANGTIVVKLDKALYGC